MIPDDHNLRHIRDFVEEIRDLLRERRSCSQHVTKEDLEQMESRLSVKLDKIMAGIQDFATAVNAFNDRIDKAITGLQGDVKNLEDQIAALQASPGTITPADQALLDGIQARASSVADKLDALDALTPPVAPPAVP